MFDAIKIKKKLVKNYFKNKWFMIKESPFIP